MDTLGSTSWLESAVNSLKNGDTSWLTQGVSPSNVKSVLSKVLGGDSGASTAGAKTGTKAGTTGSSAFGGILPVAVDSGPSALEQVTASCASGRAGMDEMARLMAQSGKGA
jgi:hypothetical protein